MGTKITEIAWISVDSVNKSIKKHFFRKKSPKKFVSSKKSCTFAPAIKRDASDKENNAEIAQLVEHNLAKVGVAGPSPVFRSLVEQKRDVKEWP